MHRHPYSNRHHSRYRVGVNVGFSLPYGFISLNFGGRPYFYNSGIFYEYNTHGHYVVVRPPIGCVVPVLPPRFGRVRVGSTFYYYYDDIYYRPVRGGYMVVETPSTVIIQEGTNPEDTKPVQEDSSAEDGVLKNTRSLWLNETEYLLKDGQFFTKSPEGLVWTEPPIGAKTPDLPPGANRIWYREKEFFEYESLYFRNTPGGYELVAPPWDEAESP